MCELVSSSSPHSVFSPVPFNVSGIPLYWWWVLFPLVLFGQEVSSTLEAAFGERAGSLWVPLGLTLEINPWLLCLLLFLVVEAQFEDFTYLAYWRVLVHPEFLKPKHISENVNYYWKRAYGTEWLVKKKKKNRYLLSSKFNYILICIHLNLEHKD